MFFSITRCPLENFSHEYQLGPFILNTDPGWDWYNHGDCVAVYKGYADSAKLSSILDQVCCQDEPKFFGNFCMIVYNRTTGQLKIQTDRLRNFPIYINDNFEITNLKQLSRVAWADSLITVNLDFSIVESKFDLIGHIDTSPISCEELIAEVDRRLNEKTQNFVDSIQLPIKVFLSGGVDSALVYSYLQKFTQDFELVNYNIIEYDKFWLQNSGDISCFWGYSQIHHWLQSCILTSGAPGDEFMLRSPVTADLFLKYHGIQITDLLNQQDWLHSSYFKKQKHLDIFQQQVVDQQLPKQEFYWNLCNIVVNDWQHWHLGNTLTWTPLRDLEIFKLFLRLPTEQALTQIMDSAISKQLIENNSPGLTQIISDQKNAGNVMKNLCSLLL
jgi:hypothetical protein